MRSSPDLLPYTSIRGPLMALTLSSPDSRRLQAVLETLLSPLDFEEVDQWRSAVNRSAKSLVGADMASFLLPTPDRIPLHSEEITPDGARQYTRRMPRIPGMVTIWQRQVDLGVFNRAMLYEGYLEEYHRSKYYNDYIVPERAYDTLAVSLSLGPEARPDSIAGLLFHHDRPDARPFGRRGLDLVHLIRPAFSAGVHTWRSFAERRSSFARLLDEKGEACLLCDRSGRVLHHTSGLTRLLADELAPRDIIDAARRMANSLAMLRQSGRHGDAGSVNCTYDVTTSRGQYHFDGCLVCGDLCGGKDAVLVTIRRPSGAIASREKLQKDFGLTLRQAEVAVLLEEGRSNTDIARTLYISRHTAHHHTEQVLLKLGAGSRAEVGAKIRSSPD